MKIAFYLVLFLAMTSCKSLNRNSESEERQSSMRSSFDDDPSVVFDAKPDHIDDLCDDVKLRICQKNSGGYACYKDNNCVAN